jgi:predicted RNA-binding Zn ribbon-like protein
MSDVMLTGGDPVDKPVSLEFTNTVRWHASQNPEDTLRSYADLVSWARKAGLATDREARRLLNRARVQPEEAGRALERARRLREAIYEIFLALIDKRPVRKADLDQLNLAIRQLEEGARIEHTRAGFVWVWNNLGVALDSLLAPIALSAVNLLLSERHRWVGQCADDRGCGWLFLDTSKNHSRRWCDMNDCGNRAKQRRLKERRQVQS